jgi:invasion protein IalB
MDDKTRNLSTLAGIGVGALVVGLLAGWIIGASHAHDGSAKIELYKDWRLACPADDEKDKDGKSKGTCALATDVNDPSSGQRLAQVTMGAEPGKPDVEMMVINVPLTVLIQPGVGVQVGSDTRTVAYATCLPTGCVATLPVDDKLSDELRTATSVNLIVTAENSRTVPLPMSVQGYAEAAARMNATEARRRSWWKRLWS